MTVLLCTCTFYYRKVGTCMAKENYNAILEDEIMIGGEEELELDQAITEDEFATSGAKEKRRECWERKHHHKCDNRQKTERARRKHAAETTTMWRAKKFRPMIREKLPT